MTYRVFFELPPLPRYPHSEKRAGWCGYSLPKGYTEYATRKLAEAKVKSNLEVWPDMRMVIVDMVELNNELS